MTSARRDLRIDSGDAQAVEFSATVALSLHARCSPVFPNLPACGCS
jgi:hypothetical protein